MTKTKMLIGYIICLIIDIAWIIFEILVRKNITCIILSCLIFPITIWGIVRNIIDIKKENKMKKKE